MCITTHFLILIILKMKKVIVQDTDIDLLETLTIVLKDAGFDVLPVREYKDVIKHIPLFSPNLVLLDYKLAGEQSINICQSVKRRFPQLPVIALSCNLTIQKEYARAGFDDYIEKPFELDHLIKVVNKTMAL